MFICCETYLNLWTSQPQKENHSPKQESVIKKQHINLINCNLIHLCHWLDLVDLSHLSSKFIAFRLIATHVSGE